MNTKELIDLLGGPGAVIEETELSKGRISQWVTDDEIPRPWLKFYKLRRPDIPWTEYEGRSRSLHKRRRKEDQPHSTAPP